MEQPTDPPKVTVPPVPESVLRIQRIRAGGIVLVGLAFMGLVLVMALMLLEVRDANRDREAAEGETNCYRELTVEQDRLLVDQIRLEGEINIKGWQALLAFYGGATEEQTMERASEMTGLVDDWEKSSTAVDQAVIERSRGPSICERESQ